MLSYQHAFHAGNHADILKHFCLVFVLDSLNRKHKPYTFFDTHSGSGLYSLQDERLLKTGEAENGIRLVLEHKEELPPGLSRYISLIQDYTKLGMYPGSPELERRLLREQDFLVLSELHPQEIQVLRQNLVKNPFVPLEKSAPVQVHFRDGFELLNALTPPATKRGAVLIDPSYEEKSDYESVQKTVTAVHKKWSSGILMVWYPLLLHRERETALMLQSMADSAKMANPNIELADLRVQVKEKSSIDTSGKSRLYGSGVFVMNAPWGLAEAGKSACDFLTSFFQKVPS